jgi:hypothetical protein
MAFGVEHMLNTLGIVSTRFELSRTLRKHYAIFADTFRT